MPARSRSQAQKRLTLDKLGPGLNLVTEGEGGLPEQTLQAMLDAFAPFIPGMIETLGMAAQPTRNQDGSTTPGDLDAAKKALDFLSKALAGNKADRKAESVLSKIAEIRGGSTPADS